MQFRQISVIRVAIGVAVAIIAGIFGAGSLAHGATSTKSSSTIPNATVTTRHSLRLGRRIIHYTAVAGKITLRDGNNQPTARMFYIAYTQDRATESTRPITFIYGGGPGATSTGLQMVGFGPKRVITANAAHTPPAPYKIVDNDYTLLNATDMVYVEEVGTGFSRLADNATLSKFAGVDEDAKAFEQFIIRYLDKYKRWNSPKYLMGNSYGTTRSAVLVNDLQSAGVDFRGVILISTVLDFETIAFGRGNDLPYVLYLPTYAAVAWYHHALSQELESEPLGKVLSQVQDFAVRKYSQFLLQGTAAGNQEKNDVLRKLSAYTGLSQQYIQYSNYRVRPTAFRKQLLRSRDQVIGRMGGRFTGKDYDQVTDDAEYDPIDPAIGGAYTASMNYYLRHDLHYTGSAIWRMEDSKAFRIWDWRKNRHGQASFNQGYVDVAYNLRQAMIDNPHLKIFVACGYYDLATPYYAVVYTLNHLRIGGLQKNITRKCYKSGHVMYLRPKSLVKIHKDLEAFYAST